MVSERGTADARGARSRAAKDERCTGEHLGRCAGAGGRRSPLAGARAERRGADPGAAEAERLPRRQRPRHDGRIQRIRRADRQAPGAAGDLPPLGQQPQRRPTNAGAKPATRPILHISTADDQTLAELITPEQIALGAGDDYLLQLNDFFANHGLPAYIRPLGEPNRCLNVWSAVNCDGSQKGGEHTTGWYKQAFRRIAAIVRGGQTPGRDQRDPGGNRPAAAEPDQRAEPGQPAGGAGEHRSGARCRAARRGSRATSPATTGPGSRWVDWVGTDFYSAISRLERPQPLLPGQAVAQQAGRDHRVGGLRRRRTALRQAGVAWTVKRPRVRMLVYYDGFGPGNQYDLRLYPRTANTLRLQDPPRQLPLRTPNTTPASARRCRPKPKRTRGISSRSTPYRPPKRRARQKRGPA